MLSIAFQQSEGVEIALPDINEDPLERQGTEDSGLINDY